jgi:colicin import membrane protein
MTKDILKIDSPETIPTFPFYLRRSFYVHLLLIIVSLTGGKIVLEQRKLLQEKNLQLVEASVRVDMVAMPKYTLNELKNLSSGVEDAKPQEVAPTKEVKEEPKVEKTEVANEEPKVEPKVEVKDNSVALEEAQKQKRKDFLGKLKEISAKKVKSTGDQKGEKGLYGANDKGLKDLVLQGNKVSKGVAMYGSGNTAEMTAFQVYVSKLPDRIRPYWRLPSFLLEKKLKCRVRVWINLAGELVRSEVYQSSGDSEYDTRALEAVKSASPFPKLSEEFGKRAVNGDIVLGFPL